MSAFAQKTSQINNLNRFAEDKFASLQQILTKSVPATIVKLEKNNTIATVKFEIDSQFTLPQVKMPVYGPEYVRWPLQEGCKGYVVPSDLAIGAMSGLGKGTATMTPQFNLAAGVFFPMGNKEFDDTDDPQKVVLYGPDGVILRNKDKDSVVDVDKEHITYALNDHTYLSIDKDSVNIDFAASTAASHAKGAQAGLRSAGASTATLVMDKDGMRLTSFGREINFSQNGLEITADGTSFKFDANGITVNTPHNISTTVAGNDNTTVSGTTTLSSTGNMTFGSSANVGISGVVCSMNGTTQSSIGASNATTLVAANRAYSSISGWGSMDLNSAANSATMSTPWCNMSLTNVQALVQYGNCYVQCHSNGNSVLMGAANTYTQVAGGGHYTVVSGGNVQMVGSECYVASRRFLDHNHWGVQSGGSNTQGVN